LEATSELIGCAASMLFRINESLGGGVPQCFIHRVLDFGSVEADHSDAPGIHDFDHELRTK
jgi:hypothetical protein